MLSPALVIGVLVLYAGALFLIALWVERRAAGGRDVGDSAAVYALSSGVWLTGWTFYGHVGKAASSGLMYLTPHLGATLSILLWWIVVRKMVRIRHAFRITSIADLVSLRYGRSPWVASLATVIAVVGIVPYVALQLKAIRSTFAILVDPGTPGGAGPGLDTGWLVPAFLIVFTIAFGVRRIVPTERHQGMVVAMAAETWVKVLAFLAVGLFVTYHVFDGFDDVFRRFAERAPLLAPGAGTPGGLSPWIANLLMAMSAVVFVPALFHVMVVENFREQHLRAALWVLPTCMLLINLFILPIAMGGLLLGGRAEEADAFVLTIPHQAGHPWLSLFVFIGGFSSAMGMTVVSAMTLSTMVTNHLILPVAQAAQALAGLKRRLLHVRWLVVAALILASSWFEGRVGHTAMLATLGGFAFIAILQLAPTIVGGLFWRRGNRAGALLGMGAGFAVWIYTLIVPAFASAGWIDRALLDRGPLGLGILRPEHLFGSRALDPTSHAVLWSLLLNVGLYVLGSLWFDQVEDERSVSEQLVAALHAEPAPRAPVLGEAVIARADKEARIEALFGEYFPAASAAAMTRSCVARLGIDGRGKLSVTELAELASQVEKDLASSIGAAAAHTATRRAALFAPAEERELKDAYAGILAGLRLPPSTLARQIDYYRDREQLLSAQAAVTEVTLRQRDREVAERKSAQAALAEQESRYRGLFDGIPTGVFRTTPEGEILDINLALVEMLGFPDRESVRSLRTQSLYAHPEDRKAWQAILERDGVLRDFETRMKRHDGAVIWVRMTSRAVKDAEGRIRTYEGTVEDITDDKRAAEERARLEEQLRQSQKMETVGLLAGGVAHDFNNLLTPILGYTELLLAELPAVDDRREPLQEMQQAAELARDLTQRLLAFSRKQVLELKTVALGDLVRRFERVLRRTIRENVRIEVSIASSACVRADARQLEQVLLNLSINAQDAMPRGGVLRVEATDVELAEEYCAAHAEISPGWYVMLAVSDTGVGMDEETARRVFEPFFTTKELGKGTGLGLSTVYGIVKQHGGSIAVYSEPAHGTVFKVFLPRVAGDVEEPRPTPAPPPRGTETIALVEDNEMVRNLARRMLESLGYLVLPAADPERCIQLVDGHQGHVDLLVTDLVLPGKNGMELFEALRRVRPELRALFMSGYSRDVIGHRGVIDEGVRFIQKPFSMSALSSAVRQALDG